MHIIVVGSFLMYRIYLNYIDRKDKLFDKTLAYIPILKIVITGKRQNVHVEGMKHGRSRSATLI